MLETVPELIGKATFISKKLRKLDCKISPEEVLMKCESVAELNFYFYKLQPIPIQKLQEIQISVVKNEYESDKKVKKSKRKWVFVNGNQKNRDNRNRL